MKNSQLFVLMQWMLMCVFIFYKLCAAGSISWGIVFSPFWIPWIICFVIAVILLLWRNKNDKPRK